MTRRKKLLGAGVILFLFIGLVGLWSVYGTIKVSLTEAQVQERINKQLDKEFPVKGPARILVKTVNIQNAAVHINEGHVTSLIDIEGTMRAGKKFTLTAYAVGVPAYSGGAFFFKPEKVEVQKFAYEGSTPTELFTRFAKRYVSDDKARQFIEDKAPKAEEWMTALAQSAATHSLEHRPIYRLKDDAKGLIIKASLESVKIDQDQILITFSLWQLTLSVLIGLVCLLMAVAMMFAFMEHPLLGLTFIALS